MVRTIGKTSGHYDTCLNNPSQPTRRPISGAKGLRCRLCYQVKVREKGAFGPRTELDEICPNNPWLALLMSGKGYFVDALRADAIDIIKMRELPCGEHFSRTISHVAA